jgi:hypothetical protein
LTDLDLRSSSLLLLLLLVVVVPTLAFAKATNQYHQGYHEGAVAADKENTENTVYFHGCPAGHTKEYCAGYKAGCNAEAYDIWA